MQPDLLPSEKEENQSEPSLTQQEPMPSGSPSLEATQLTAHPAEDAADVDSSTAGPKRSKFNMAYLALGVLVVLLLAAFAWVGYWVYDLTTQLTGTQRQLAALQTDHSQLQADYETLNTTLKSENEKLNAELAQARENLEKANSDLAAAQSNLAKSQAQTKSLDAQIAKASKLAEILYAFSSVRSEIDFLELDQLIRGAKNQELLTEWNSIKSEEDFRNFPNYLILATRDSLK